ncbi:hypothetical protein [Aeoliella sp.]|uniref:hypothetical protein n=1 Tax=Aeoliella sp. TaxID=2795800 RepID=UPI003CCBD88D
MDRRDLRIVQGQRIMPQYKKIAGRFCIGNAFKEYHGAVIASDEAFFLVIDRSEYEALGQTLASSGWPSGYSLGKFISKLIEPTTLDYNELPPQLTDDPSWPIKRTEARVIVLPKTAVSGLNSRYWGAPLSIEAGGERYFISVGILTWSRTMKYLRSQGWEEQFSAGRSISAASYEAPVVGFSVGVFAGIAVVKLTDVDKVFGLSVEAVAAIPPVIGLLCGLLYAYLRR